ncbi:MAG: S10 family peptidase [Terriglobia bacterium]
MWRSSVLLVLCMAIFYLGVPSAAGAQNPGARETATTPHEDKSHPAKGPEASTGAEKPPVVTQHQIHADGRALNYTATTGELPIRNEDGATTGHIFFVAYTLDNPPNPTQRPLTFTFNGGPGSASVWLHLGAIGPKRVGLLPNGKMPHPPFRLTDNQDTWLDMTDLVFIDPVGTGYSRATKKEYEKDFWGVKADISSVGEFIRLYLTRYQRWTSPLFLAGESYGTTRAAGLSGYLMDHGIALNGIVLISTVLNFQTLQFTRGNDLPYVLYLPSYTATAWYYKKLAPDLEQNLDKTLSEVEPWALTRYSQALAQGDQLTGPERADAIDRLSRYTGLSKTYIDRCNLRISGGQFRAELLRGQGEMVGRLDTRFTGYDRSGVAERPDYDPSEAAIRPPFTSTFGNYVRDELGYKTDNVYYILGGGVKHWDWGSSEQGFPETFDALRSAFIKNPYMKLYVAMGHFDLATPFFAVEYTLDHLNLPPALRSNITTGYYEAGHMIYIRDKSLAKLKQNVAAFMQSALQ